MSGSGVLQLPPGLTHLLLIELRLPWLTELTHGSWGWVGWVSTEVLGPSQVLVSIPESLLHPLPIPASESPQRQENKGPSVWGKLPWGTPGQARTLHWSAGRMESCGRA